MSESGTLRVFDIVSTYANSDLPLIDGATINITVLKRLAGSGVPAALHALAELHLYGVSPFSRDFGSAIQLFERAADAGFSESFSRLSFLYRHGIGVQRDLVKSIVYQEFGCLGKSAAACLAQGYSLLDGIGRPMSNERGVGMLLPIGECIGQLSEANTLPKSWTGRLTTNMTFPPKVVDDAREIKLLSYQAEMGDPDSEVAMGEMYYFGDYGEAVDFHRARALFERHPEDPNALVILGRMYHIGEGVPVDLDRAEQLYQRAVKLKHTSAMNNLGVLKNQKGDFEGGARLLEQAAAGGHAGAMYNLAIKRLAEHEDQEAVTVLRSLARNGSVLGQHMLARTLMVSGAEYDPIEAAYWIKQVLARGPWANLEKTAEEYWNDGNRVGAVLLWMELADGGLSDAAFNAGYAMLEGEGLELEKGAVSMFRRLNEISGEDVSVYLSRAYALRGKTTKAREVLTDKASSPTGWYELAEAHLDGRIVFRLAPVIGNLSLAIDHDVNFILPAAILAPRVALASARQVWKCFSGSCEADEIGDIADVFFALCRRGSNTAGCLLAIFALIVYVRKRIATTLAC
jgi:TPR repeat protein